MHKRMRKTRGPGQQTGSKVDLGDVAATPLAKAASLSLGVHLPSANHLRAVDCPAMHFLGR